MSFSFFSYHLGNNIFGLVNATTDTSYIYLSDKLQAGAKSGNHTSNFLLQYVQHLCDVCIHHSLTTPSYIDNHLPYWVQNIEVFMDNAGNT